MRKCSFWGEPESVEEANIGLTPSLAKFLSRASLWGVVFLVAISMLIVFLGHDLRQVLGIFLILVVFPVSGALFFWIWGKRNQRN